MRALTSSLAVFVLGSSLAAIAAGGGCTSDDETIATPESIVACSAARMPRDGELCDPNELAELGYCRAGDCSGQCLDECRCRSGRWLCNAKRCRDGEGCGTAPKCIEQPCHNDGGIELCPALASSCPSGCNDVTARRIDADLGCVWPAEIVQCSTPSMTTACTAGPTCLFREQDNVAFWFTTDCHRMGWRPCTETERAVASDGPICGFADTGTDTGTAEMDSATEAATDTGASVDANADADARADAADGG